MNYLDIMVGRREYEERVRWLRSLYGSSSHSDQPSRLARLAKRLLYVVGTTLVLLGERMQQPRQNMPTTAPVTK
jgi:hypothetical protein